MKYILVAANQNVLLFKLFDLLGGATKTCYCSRLYGIYFIDLIFRYKRGESNIPFGKTSSWNWSSCGLLLLNSSTGILNIGLQSESPTSVNWARCKNYQLSIGDGLLPYTVLFDSRILQQASHLLDLHVFVFATFSVFAKTKRKN